MRIRGAEKWMDGWMDGPLLFQSFQKRIIVIYGKKVAAPGTHIWPRCKLQVYQLSVKVIQKKVQNSAVTYCWALLFSLPDSQHRRVCECVCT